jgi:hypothetical protein
LTITCPSGTTAPFPNSHEIGNSFLTNSLPEADNLGRKDHTALLEHLASETVTADNVESWGRGAMVMPPVHCVSMVHWAAIVEATREQGADRRRADDR